jgi:hypothetical protein
LTAVLDGGKLPEPARALGPSRSELEKRIEEEQKEEPKDDG